MKGASNIAPMGIRIPDDLKEKIQNQARENGRSTNAEILQILETFLTNNPNKEAESAKETAKHLQRLLDVKDEIIELQKDSMAHMEKTISSLNESISSLKKVIDLYDKSKR